MDILVVKYFERFTLNVPGVPDAWPQWAKITVATVKENYKPVKRLRTKHISREEARRLIRENGLVEVHSDRDGKVWDTPDKLFQRKHAGIQVPQIV